MAAIVSRMPGSSIVHDREIGDATADAGNKEAAGSFIGEIGVTKADEAAGSFAGEIVVTKADARNKEAASSITGDLDVIKGEVAAAGKGVVTEVEWIQFVFPKLPVGLLERKAEPTGALITKEMVPDVIVDRVKTKRPFKKLPPTLRNTTGVYDRFPENRDLNLANRASWNYLVDLQADVKEQHEKNGFAEVGVDFTDGVKKIFILPRPQPQVMTKMEQQDDGSGGKSETTLVFVSGFAILFALLVLLLSLLLSRVKIQV